MRSAPLSAIVLAGGDGRRMRSTRPKPLHVLCGKTMLHYVLDSLSDAQLRLANKLAGSVLRDPETISSPTPRNAKCPCGSGKRYKHCHGATAA